MGAEPPPLSAAEARATCHAEVARFVKPLLLAIGLLLFGFTFVTPFVTPFPTSVPIAVAEAILGFAFLGGHIALKRPSGEHRVNAIFTALSIGAISMVILSFALMKSAQVNSAVVLLVLSAGIVMLSWPWFIAVVGIYAVGWTAAMFYLGPPEEWAQLLFTVAAAAVLSVMAHAARLSTHLRLEALRRHEVRQREELEEGLRALRETQDRLQRVLSAAPVIVFATDALGMVTLVGGRGLAARGWDKIELVGRRAEDVLSALPAERARMDRALLGESTVGTTIQDGTTLDTFWSPALDEDGRVAGAICVAIDVSERVRALEEERKAAQRETDIEHLREMDKFKTRILNTASHELNTPLTPIKLQMHLLKRSASNMNDAQQRAIALLDRNVDRLAGLVSDIMDVARLQEGHLHLQPADIDLGTVVLEAVASYDAVARSKSIDLRADVESGVMVRGDAGRLMQILFNLLGNATKFTPDGGAIKVEMHAKDSDIVLSVSDTGPGMDADQLARLFRPFSQVHDLARTSHGGTGLGLYISRGLAEHHGGALTCESEGPDQGTTFRLTLPRLVAPTA